MSKMSLGNTLEEKRQTYEVLTNKSKKWGKVFAIVSAIFGLFMGITLLGSGGDIFTGLLFIVILVVCAPLAYYWYGQIVYYGYLVIRAFFSERNIGAGAVAGAVGTSFLVSYALGGRKAAKKLGIAWLIILVIALSIGIFVGLYYYIKFRKEAKELGFINNKRVKQSA